LFVVFSFVMMLLGLVASAPEAPAIVQPIVVLVVLAPVVLLLVWLWRRL